MTVLDRRADVGSHAPRLLQALLDADRPAVDRVIGNALADSGDGIAVIDELLVPAMYEIGRLWETGEIAIADEHMATATAHSALGRLYPSLVTAPPRSRGVVLLAGADGEQHMFGLRMIADVLEGAGFDVRNTAGSLPPEALAAAVRRHRPALVGLAHTVGDPEPLLACIAAARAVAPGLPVLIGGGAVAAAVDVGLDPGVQACRSARGALESALALTRAG